MMENTKPILSVAVPSYNVEQYLDKGLKSYADDRLRGRLEVLIVNDGSTDKTEEIAKRYVSAYPDIFRLINKENGGHGSAVNAGIDNATGKYFRIIDGDDWIHTDNMVKLLNIMEKSDTDMIVDEKREVHMVTGATQLFPIPEYVKTDKPYDFDEICIREDIGSFIMIHTLSVKTELLKKADIKLLEHIFYVDYEYIVKATCIAKTIMFLGFEVYQYLVGNVNQSVSSANYVKRYSHHEAVTKEMLRFDKASDFTGNRKEYLERKVQLIIHTHFNICLIFDSDRRRGAGRAKAFRSFLKAEYPLYYRKTAKRYYTAYLLHILGFDAERLSKLMGR